MPDCEGTCAAPQRPSPLSPPPPCPGPADRLADVLLAGSGALPTLAPAPTPPAEQWALPTLAPGQQQLYQLPARPATAGWAYGSQMPVQQAGGAPFVPLAAVEQAPQLFGAPAEHGLPPTWQRHPPAVPAHPGALHGAAGASSSSSGQDAELAALLAGVAPTYEEVRVSLKVRCCWCWCAPCCCLLGAAGRNGRRAVLASVPPAARLHCA